MEQLARPESQRVADIGELGLIERLARIVQADAADPFRPSAAGEIAIGDDAAVWSSSVRWQVLTTDALVEGVHFRLDWTDWRALGWKAMAENLSDVAAMGAGPRRAFVTLGLRGETPLADLDELYHGMVEIDSEFGVRIVGGDTVSSPVTFLNISVVGELDGPGLRRGAGRAGDLLAVTGTLGGSAGGLELLQLGTLTSTDADEQDLLARHRRPRPRVREGLLLADVGLRCGMDLSDGILGDVAKLAHASNVGADISWDVLPVYPPLERRFGRRARPLALAGGEDYELLVAGPAALIEEARRALKTADLAPLTVVGQLTASAGGLVRVVDAESRELQSTERSWDHWQL